MEIRSIFGQRTDFRSDFRSYKPNERIFGQKMAEVKQVPAQTTEVERVVIEEVETRPEGYELFLTVEEMKGLRTFIGLGTTSKTVTALGLQDLWERIYDVIKPDWSVHFNQVAKLND